MSIPLVRVHGVNDVRLDAVEKPRITANDILVQVHLCGICGSDLGYIAMGGLGMTQPMPLGHELVGVVTEAGANVNHVTVGDRIVVNPTAANNHIGNGGPEGGFSPWLLVRDVATHPAAALRVPATLSSEQAAMVEPLAVGLHGCHQGNAKADDKAVVLGAGPIGLGSAACLKYLGLKDVIIVDRSEHRLRAAERLGIAPLQADDADLSDFLKAQHGEASLLGSPVPATDLYLEATGVGAVFNQVVNIAKPGARVVVLGLHKAPVELDLVNVLMRELSIIGSMAYPEEFPKVIEMLNSGSIDVQPMISHQFPLSDFEQALSIAQDPEQATKVMIDCQT